MIKHNAVSAAFLTVIVPCGFLLNTGSLMALPPSPSFEGHHDVRSREPSASSLSYDWSCRKIERSIEFFQSYRQVPDKDGDPSIVATWSIGRYIRNGELAVQVGDELSAFVSSLKAVSYIAGRCFDTEGEVRISGMVADSDVLVTRSFRIR